VSCLLLVVNLLFICYAEAAHVKAHKHAELKAKNTQCAKIQNIASKQY